MADNFGIIKVGIAFITFIAGILGIYHKLKNSLSNSIKDLESLRVELDKETKKREDEIRSLMEFFKNELREEVERIQQTLNAHKTDFSRLFEKVEGIKESIATLGSGLQSHISNQEKICKLNHRK